MGKSLISSPKTSVALLALFAASMATATFVEKFYGTTAAKTFIYYNPLFFLLLCLIVINSVSFFVNKSLFCVKKCGFLFVHLSFIIIMLGALTTHFAGREGALHLRNGEISDRMKIKKTGMAGDEYSEHKFPFRIELVRFTLKRYPGSQSPSSFESLVRIYDGDRNEEHLIAMNRVLDYRGYRFFQSSFDTDEQGSILSVNQDVAGRTITYAGYFCLFLGFVLILVQKGGRIRNLMGRLSN